MIRIIAAALLALVSTLTFAQAPNPPARVRGTVEKLDNNVMTVKAPGGKAVSVKLADNYTVVGVSRAKIADIGAGKFIGTATLGERNGGLVALEVHIFPEAMRGTGEGHYSWDLRPKSTMTNANVDQVVTAVDGQTLTLKYKDGEKKIFVPANTPIVVYVQGDKSDLKPGAKVFIAAIKQPDGTLQGRAWRVGRDGVTPPM
jgi:hypothetical protein